MVPSPVDPSLVLFLGTEGINWITQDCGTSIKAMNQGRRVEEIQFHPTEKTWMLAYAWTTCEDFVGEPCKKYKELFLTKDLGESWEFLANYVYQFSW
jgi:Sortilin, neurotensin receptor 3,